MRREDAGFADFLRSNQKSNTYHSCEAGIEQPCVRVRRGAVPVGSSNMFMPRSDVLTCILLVTAALLASIAKCTSGCDSKFP